MKAADAINHFVKLTADRLPTVEELLALCDACDITFKLKNGEPCLSAPQDVRPITLMVKELISREPWRSQVITHRLNQEQSA